MLEIKSESEVLAKKAAQQQKAQALAQQKVKEKAEEVT